MKVRDFLKVNNLKQVDLARYLCVTEAAISNVVKGKSEFSEDNLIKIVNNPHGWDVTMLTSDQPENPAEIKPDMTFIKNSLMKHIESQDATISSLLDLLKAEREKVERLEEELRTYRERKGETAPAAAASSAARAV